MRLELFHRWHCPYSKKVRDFIDENKLGEQLSLLELDEESGAVERLVQITGEKRVPCLIIDGKPLLESDVIISWMQENLLRNHQDSSLT